MLLAESIWLGLGVFSCWFLWPSVVGRTRRWLLVAFCTVMFFLPVAWMEGRWVHWWWLQPRIGEPLDEVVSRLGAAERIASGQWVIWYKTPFYWLIPAFGMIEMSADSAGRVESWNVAWR